MADEAMVIDELTRARFWSGVGVGAPKACWPWRRGTRKKYGRIKIGGRGISTHRLAFFLSHGRWPQALLRHTCDNPPCVNPAHLIEGTDADNQRDKVLRGRAPSCDHHPSAKLTAAQVIEIRQRRGERQRDLAKEYGVHQATIWRIVNDLRWRALDAEPTDGN